MQFNHRRRIRRRRQVGEAPGQHVYHKGRGCQSCNFTGYSGRIGVYELLELDQAMMDALRRNDAEGFARAAREDPKISLATVYRTVKLFEDSGIIERHDFRDGRSRYEEAQRDGLKTLEKRRLDEAIAARVVQHFGPDATNEDSSLYGLANRIYGQMVEAPSAGQFFAREIKPNYVATPCPVT